jgi:Na+(H+)/acetate symporter ActP
VVSGLVAAGGLAAALSTADGLLLTIANALSHDLYYKMIDPNASTARRVALSKMLLLVVALAAAYVAAQKPADILFLVSAAFSFAAAAFFPALTLGIFWKRATGIAASLGMVAGLGTPSTTWSRPSPGCAACSASHRRSELWWDIQPISAGVFGVPVGFAVIVLVSLLTPGAEPPRCRPWCSIRAIRTSDGADADGPAPSRPGRAGPAGPGVRYIAGFPLPHPRRRTGAASDPAGVPTASGWNPQGVSCVITRSFC